MKEFNCALIHTPKLYKEDGKLYSKINFCAMGLFSLAGELNKNGFDTTIIHLGIEKYLDKSFKLSEYTKENKIRFLAFSLQWHEQSYDVIETASKVKKQNSDVHISLGGFTASYFADEIMRNYPFIDSIIKGEGELPILELVKAIYQKKATDNIPNLYWRKNNSIILNKETYTAENNDLNNFEFFNPDKMLNYDTYTKTGYILDYSKNSMNDNRIESHGITLGRGCLGNCVWCGGGAKAQKKVLNRSFVSYRSPNSVTEEIKKLKKQYNINNFRFSFDPNPYDRKPLIDTLKEIEKEFNGEITANYNMDGLPDKNFLDAFKKAFSSSSLLLINPVFADETLRKKYKSFFYSNEQLEETLDYMNKLEINTEIYFSKMPSVPEKENEKSKEYGNYLKAKYKNIKEYYLYPVDIEPASPWTYCPKKYGLKDVKRTFNDYYTANLGLENSFEKDF